jgi:hypothetical protein
VGLSLGEGECTTTPLVLVGRLQVGVAWGRAWVRVRVRGRTTLLVPVPFGRVSLFQAAALALALAITVRPLPGLESTLPA